MSFNLGPPASHVLPIEPLHSSETIDNYEYTMTYCLDHQQSEELLSAD
jgi:hypothetical protein